MAEIDSRVPFVGVATKDEYLDEAAFKAEFNLSLAVANEPEYADSIDDIICSWIGFGVPEICSDAIDFA